MPPWRRVEVASEERRRADEAVSFNEPRRVVDLAERQQSLAQFLDRLEVAYPQQVFLERADEPFSTAVTLGRADEGGRTFDAEEADLPLRRTRVVALRRPAAFPSHRGRKNFNPLGGFG